MFTHSQRGFFACGDFRGTTPCKVEIRSPDERSDIRERHPTCDPTFEDPHIAPGRSRMSLRSCGLQFCNCCTDFAHEMIEI